MHSFLRKTYLARFQAGQLLVGQKRLCDRRVERPSDSRPFTRFVLKRHLDPVHRKGRVRLSISTVVIVILRVQLLESLTDELASLSLHLSKGSGYQKRIDSLELLNRFGSIRL